jgi:hypothetical protein
MEDTLDSIVLILGMILIRHAIPKSQKSLGRHIFHAQVTRKSGCTSGIIVSTICRKPGSSAPQIPKAGSDGLSFRSGSLSKVKIGMLQLRNNGICIFLCAEVAANGAA